MKKIIHMIILIKIVFVSFLSAQNIDVLFPPSEYQKINTSILKNVIEENVNQLKLENNFVKVFY